MSVCGIFLAADHPHADTSVPYDPSARCSGMRRWAHSPPDPSPDSHTGLLPVPDAAHAGPPPRGRRARARPVSLPGRQSPGREGPPGAQQEAGQLKGAGRAEVG